jgi:DNA-binding IclR family transcriptional regulator
MTNIPADTQADDRPLIVSVERTLIVLDLIARSPDGIGTREISYKLGYGAGTVQKILNTLHVHEYVTKRAGTDKYVIGIGAIRIANLILAQSDLLTITRPYLQRLADESQETIFMGIYEDGQVTYIDKVVSDQIVRMDAPLGVRRPINCTAIGKAMLAFSPRFSRDWLRELHRAKTFTRPTEFSITDPDVLYDDLKQALAAGFTSDRREFNPSAMCVAAPIFDHANQPVAAISISGPAERIEPQFDKLAAMVRRTTAQISKALGADQR